MGPVQPCTHLHTDGVKTGCGPICGLHSNADDAPNIYCRIKALTFGELSDEECRVRLKRWLLAGLHDAPCICPWGAYA